MPGPDSGDRTRNASAPVKTLTVKASVVSCQCIGPVHWSYFISWQRRDLQPSRSHRARFIGAVAKVTYHWTMWYVSRPLYTSFLYIALPQLLHGLPLLRVLRTTHNGILISRIEELTLVLRGCLEERYSNGDQTEPT